MPTGYTAGILDGEIKTFPEFVKTCMRAFGATIHLRDEPLAKEYEPRVPSDYYSKNIAEKKDAISKYTSISDDEIITLEKGKLEGSKKYHLESIIKIKANRKKLIQMLMEAKRFVPPTSEHEEFKKFMIEQLTSTIDFDCKTEYHDEALIEIETKLSNLDAEKVRKELIAEAEKSLSYYLTENAEEIKRCEDANEWVAQLLESVAPHSI